MAHFAKIGMNGKVIQVLTGWTYQVSEIHIWDGHIQEVHNISMKRLEEEYGRLRKT